MKEMSYIKDFKYPYFDGAEKYLNELTSSDIAEIIEKLNKDGNLIELLIQDYSSYTFCLQIDYDFMFGDENYRTPFLFFDDAKKCASQDEPSYSRDKSYVYIYKFKELLNEGSDSRRKFYIDKFLEEIRKIL